MAKAALSAERLCAVIRQMSPLEREPIQGYVAYYIWKTGDQTLRLVAPPKKRSR